MKWLDRGMGECQLKHKDVREIVSSALMHFDGERYEMDCYVIMPNHVHVLLRLIDPHKLSDVVKSLKSFSAREINKILKETGVFWQRDYYDRLIRSPKHFSWVRNYILENPKKLVFGSFTLYGKEGNHFE